MVDTVEGLVVRVDRRVCHVEVAGQAYTCALRGHLFEFEEEQTRPVAVGDRVKVQLQGEQGAIEEVLPRRTQILRGAGRGKVQIIAANVDLLVIVVSVKSPPLRRGMIDRLLVEAESSGVGAAVVLNKSDLCSAEEAEALVDPYRRLGYAVAVVSCLEGRGMEAVAEIMGNRLSMLVGHSGVGKSSLLNALDPELNVKVGAISRRRGMGRHTTTHTALLLLRSGARVVDCPGMREFSLAGIEPADLGAFFRDMAPFHNQCKYPTCTHHHEPHCAVKQAVTDGQIAEPRYESYCKLLDELHGGGERMPRHGSF